MVDRPLGPILQVVNGEALTKPNDHFTAKGATVVTLENKIIGKLDHPIGRTDRPYQVIKLNSNDESLVGKLVIAKVSKKKRRNRRKR